MDYWTFFACSDSPTAGGFIAPSSTIFFIHPANPHRAAVDWYEYNLTTQLGGGGKSASSDEILSCLCRKHFQAISGVVATIPKWHPGICDPLVQQ